MYFCVTILTWWPDIDMTLNWDANKALQQFQGSSHQSTTAWALLTIPSSSKVFIFMYFLQQQEN